MEGAIADGVSGLIELSPVIAVLLLVIIGLCWLVRALLKDAKHERKLNREALLNNTSVLSEFKEIIRSAIQR